MDEQKAKNLYRVLKGLTKKAKGSLYPMDKVFIKLNNEIDNNYKKTNIINEKPPLNTPFVEKREDVDRSTLYSFSGPFEALQADITDIRFLGKSAADPEYCLLFVDLFTSMIYTYPMKRRSLLAKEMVIFYQDVAKKRMGRMRLQMNCEFQQKTNIKKVNKEFDVDMYSTNLRGGKAFAAEQKSPE